MAQIGDLFAKLGSGQTLSTGEIETLRLEMNRLQNTASRLDTIMAPAGGLEPNVFRNSGPFSILPHPAAVLYKSSAQSIADSTWTEPTGWLDFSDPAIRAFGLRAEPTVGHIYTSGIAGDSVFLLFASALFASNATGSRSMRITMSDATGQVGHTVPGIAYVAGVLSTVQVSHIRVLKSDTTYVYTDVWQNSGGALDLQSILLAAVQIR